MPSYLWSDPTPSDATSATIASRSEVSAPNISGVVSAILEDRYRKEQQKQQLTDSILKSLGSVAQDYQHNADTGALADYLQGNGDISSLSPDARLKAVETQHTWDSQYDKSDLERQVAEARIAHYGDTGGSGAGGGAGSGDPNIWTDPQSGRRFAVGSSGGLHPLDPADTGVQDRFDAKQQRSDLDKQISALNGAVKSYGYDPSLLESKTNVFKGTGPLDYGTPTDKHAIPDGQYLIKGKDGTYSLAPQQSFDAANVALGQYREMLQKRAAMGEAPPQAAAPGQPEVKTLDKGTAQQFLQEAGGNMDKARELARAAGYSF